MCDTRSVNDSSVTRRRWLARAASTALAVACVKFKRASAAGPPRLRIANASGGMNLTLAALMREQRCFEAFGLEPEVLGVSDGAKILGGIIGGSVDATFMSGFGQVFPAIERGAAIRILAGGALLPLLTLYSARPQVQSLRDLDGRVVGTGAIGALIHQLTVTLLRKHGVDAGRVRFVNVGSNADVFRAVAAGTVDAGVGETALIADAAHYGVHPLANGNMTVELPGYTYQAAWAGTRVIESQRDALVRALAAYATLYRFVQSPAGHEPFLRARRTVFPRAPEADHEAQWRFIQQYRPFAVDLVLTPERLRYMQDLNLAFQVQRRLLPFERVADMSLAADALKLLAAPAAR